MIKLKWFLYGIALFLIILIGSILIYRSNFKWEKCQKSKKKRFQSKNEVDLYSNCPSIYSFD